LDEEFLVNSGINSWKFGGKLDVVFVLTADIIVCVVCGKLCKQINNGREKDEISVRNSLEY
jgi:hypothetical protein